MVIAIIFFLILLFVSDLSSFDGEQSIFRYTLAFFHAMLVVVYSKRYIDDRRRDELIVLFGLIPVPIYFVFTPTSLWIRIAVYSYWVFVGVFYVLQKMGVFDRKK